MPDFPSLPLEISDIPGDSIVSPEEVLLLFDAQVEKLQAIKQSFKEREGVADSLNRNRKRLDSLILEMEGKVSSSGLGSKNFAPEMNELFTDLFSAFNRTLEEILDTGSPEEDKIIFLEEIIENFSEIINDVTHFAYVKEKTGPLWGSFIAEIHTDEGWAVNREVFPELLTDLMVVNTMDVPTFRKSDLTRGFAFAVYKRDDQGDLITKGPEVEKKYLLKYALPALKAIPEAYHYLSGPATFATASFPPAKLYFIVEDLDGNEVPLRNALIDFKEVFHHPQLGEMDKMIIVPLFLTP